MEKDGWSTEVLFPVLLPKDDRNEINKVKMSKSNSSPNQIFIFL